MKVISPFITFSLLFTVYSAFRRPIIGIVTNPYPQDSDNSSQSYSHSSYVQFLEAQGAQVLPLLYDYSIIKMNYIIPKLNGLVFLGGDRNLRDGGKFEKQAELIIKTADNSKVPILFICQGFELMYYLLSNDIKVLENAKAWSMKLPIYLTDEGKTSRLFKFFSDEEKKKLEDKEGNTIHFHNLMVSPDAHNKYPNLDKILKITSYGYDSEGKKFIASAESKDFTKNKYFAVQFHPEKESYAKAQDQYEYSSLFGIQIAQKIGNAFIDTANETIKSNFLSEQEARKWGFIYSNEYSLPIGSSIYLYDSTMSEIKPINKPNQAFRLNN